MGKGLFTFDRADAIGTKLLLGLITVALAIYALVRPIVSWVQGKAYVTEVPTLVGMEVDLKSLQLRPGASIEAATAMQVRLDHPATSIRMLDLATGMVLVVAVVLVAWLISRLIDQIVSGDPFAGSAHIWLRSIAAVLILAPVLYLPLQMALSGSVIGQVLDTKSATAEFSIPLGFLAPMALGLVVAAIAQAFVHGRSLREDSEGLV